MKPKFIRHGEVLVPATKYDLEYLSEFKNGEALNTELKSAKPRSLSMHNMYFGGLLSLGVDYWEPKGGYISKDEKQFAIGLSEFVKSQGHDAAAIETVMKAYMESLVEVRKAMIPELSRAKRIEEMHEFVKQEAGYYDLIQTPGGLIKKTKSISFDRMSHEQFLVYYKKAFNVIWNLCLCKVFNDRAECERLIEQLSRMG